MSVSSNAYKVLKDRYLTTETGKIETPPEMFWRTAYNIALPEGEYTDDKAVIENVAQAFYHIMLRSDFMPNSPALMNAGRALQMLVACFTVPIKDSIEEIFDAVKYTALIQRAGGGTGFSFSDLRPDGDLVKSTFGRSSGPISFMNVFNAATNTIKQGGKRRGASMAVLSIHHPDILKFISCKAEDGNLSNFNISVSITHDFMHAVLNNEPYDLLNPRTGEVVGQLNAYDTLRFIATMAQLNGEPGILFIDRINELNTLPGLEPIAATNPCSESLLRPFEACVLGSINLSNMVTNGMIDWKRLNYTARLGVHFLDNTITASRYPLPQIEAEVLKTRKIGLGIMGLHEMLIKLGIPYNSAEGVGTAAEVMRFIQTMAVEKSVELAKTRGTFPAYEASTWYQQGIPVRNAMLTSIAPTGSISMICGTTPSAEPIFAIAMERNHDIVGHAMYEVNSLFARTARQLGFYSEELIEKIFENGGIQGMSEVPEEVQRLFVTAHDITPEWHIKMQAALQAYVCQAISKTINLSHEATVDDVYDAYVLAYELGVKGMTVYRDGSRQHQVLVRGIKHEHRPIFITPPKVTSVEPQGEIEQCQACGTDFHKFSGACTWCPTCGNKSCS